ncbi:MAG: biotin--[acetyl-CoA-carboxylase] ligase [Actinomycetota bacterium]
MNLAESDAIEACLTTETLGHPLRSYPIALTTESLALAWARKEDAPEGAVVMADQELSPRQRKGPPWIPFASRGLYFSVILRPALPPEGQGLVWLLASLGVAEGLGEATGLTTSLKWPDDIMIGARKIAGVKVEAQLGPSEIESAIVTVRVNLAVRAEDLPAELQGIATSVLIEGIDPPRREEVLDPILGAIERCYDLEVPVLVERYKGRCETLGRNVRALFLPRGEVRGKALDINEFGSLVVAAPEGPAAVPIGVLKKLEPGDNLAPETLPL